MCATHSRDTHHTDRTQQSTGYTMYVRYCTPYSVYAWISVVMFFGWNIVLIVFIFFFQAEDGIRDYKVTGVQTCALPICHPGRRGVAVGKCRRKRMLGRQAIVHGNQPTAAGVGQRAADRVVRIETAGNEIGRASCRERV